MRVAFTVALAVTIALGPRLSAQRATGQGRATAPAKEGPSVACAAVFGTGLKTKRQFCDVVIATDKADSIAITIPAHKGTAVLVFDLHNRYDVPAAGAAPADVFAQHEAIVAIVGPAGAVIDHAAVRDEFRSITQLFDRLAGGAGPGGTKAIAPGPAQSVRITIPAAVVSVGILGVRLTALTRTGTEVFDAPGLPVATASNFRVEYYTPR